MRSLARSLLLAMLVLPTTLPADAQDKLSLLYSFMFTTPISGKVVSLHETDGKHLEPVRYAVSKETLDTPMGKLETIVLTKQLPLITTCCRSASWLPRKSEL